MRRYRALKKQLPIIAWNETNMEQTYSSNEADDLHIRVVVELIAKPEDAYRYEDIVRIFRANAIPFTCVCGYDEENDNVSYEFALKIEEAFSDG